LVFEDGTTRRCAVHVDDGSEMCYLHAKYWDGKAAPIEYSDIGNQHKYERVVLIRDGKGNVKTFATDEEG